MSPWGLQQTGDNSWTCVSDVLYTSVTSCILLHTLGKWAEIRQLHPLAWMWPGQDIDTPHHAVWTVGQGTTYVVAPTELLKHGACTRQLIESPSNLAKRQTLGKSEEWMLHSKRTQQVSFHYTPSVDCHLPALHTEPQDKREWIFLINMYEFAY